MTNDQIWNEIIAREGRTFTDHKGRPFSYQIKRTKSGELLSELVIDGKHKAITRATLLLAYHRAEELQETKGCVASHRKLGAFGSEYLYPVFLDLGVCSAEPGAARPVPEEDRCRETTADHRETESDNTTGLSGCGSASGAVSDEETRQPVRSCRNCGYTTTEEFDFCPKCGSRLS